VLQREDASGRKQVMLWKGTGGNVISFGTLALRSFFVVVSFDEPMIGIRNKWPVNLTRAIVRPPPPHRRSLVCEHTRHARCAPLDGGARQN
jgi:hypothetical protein